MDKLSKANATLTDLLARRGIPGRGSNGFRFLELHGARIIEPTAFEPDPRTYRGEYYYNAVLNQLYRKVVSRRDENGLIAAQWVVISQ